MTIRIRSFPAALALSLATLVFASSTSFASCEQRARQTAQSARAVQIVDVRSRGSDCIIKLLVPSGKGAPRLRTVTVKK